MGDSLLIDSHIPNITIERVRKSRSHEIKSVLLGKSLIILACSKLLTERT